jgi:predicted nucleic acid-binding protein
MIEEKTRVYLDTSVISHLDHAETQEKFDITHRFWEDVKNDVYDVYMSSLVLYEIDQCKQEKRDLLRSYLNEIQYTELMMSKDVLDLANEIINCGVLTKKSFEDCQHMPLLY